VRRSEADGCYGRLPIRARQAPTFFTSRGTAPTSSSGSSSRTSEQEAPRATDPPKKPSNDTSSLAELGGDALICRVEGNPGLRAMRESDPLNGHRHAAIGPASKPEARRRSSITSGFSA
jgi:hypothetical protein